MKVSYQPQAPAALLSEDEYPVPVEEEDEWTPYQDLALWTTKSLACAGIMPVQDVTQYIRAQNGLEAVAQCLLAGAPHSCRRAAHSVTRSRIICPTLQEVRHLANQPER